MPTVLLLGTLDTKGVEYAFLRERLLEHGVEVLIVDAGIHEPVGLVPDVARGEVARAGGADVDLSVPEREDGGGRPYLKRRDLLQPGHERVSETDREEVVAPVVVEVRQRKNRHRADRWRR